MSKVVSRIVLPLLTAFVLWTLMFSPWTAAYLPFWPCMALSAAILLLIASWQSGAWWKRIDAADQRSLRYWVENLLLGVAVAAVLWGVFWLGDKLSQVLFPTFARHEVDSIYGSKDGMNPHLIGALLLLLIGPAEEIFWREHIQRLLAEHLLTVHWRDLTIGPRALACGVGILAYTLVHVFSFNLMLIIAAFVCGVAWGVLYWLFPNRFPAILLSHALWDATIFVWLPV